MDSDQDHHGAAAPRTTPLRLFIALPLPAAVHSELAAVQERLRRQDVPVRWVAPQGMHLTLQFLGATDSALVEPLLAELSLIEPIHLELRLGALGAFPDPRAPRVLWAGIAGDTDGLHQVQVAVIQATRQYGFKPEARAFHPHLTLGRVRPEATSNQLHRLSAALAAAAPPAECAWTSAGPLLYASTQTPRGAEYRVLGPG
jgi:RNA 2',3'-cyclic 3'-phosphodiesterase